jgi:hypothetical protein
MIGFGNQLTDDEIWTIIQYERSFSGGHGPRHGMGPRHGTDGTGSGCCAGQDQNP